MKVDNRFLLILSFLVLLAFIFSLVLTSPETAAYAKDEKKKIKITVEAPIKKGFAPLPVHFIAQVDASNDLDKEIYESGYEWIIYGRFVLTDPITGGNPAPTTMRRTSVSSSEYALRGTKHLVAKNRVRPPRKPYETGMEVQRTFEFDYTFDRAGEYLISFRLKGGKYRSNEFRILVEGDTTFDPWREQ